MDDDVKEWIRSELKGLQRQINDLSDDHKDMGKRFWGVVIACALGGASIIIEMLKGGSQ